MLPKEPFNGNKGQGMLCSGLPDLQNNERQIIFNLFTYFKKRVFQDILPHGLRSPARSTSGDIVNESKGGVTIMALEFLFILR